MPPIKKKGAREKLFVPEGMTDAEIIRLRQRQYIDQTRFDTRPRKAVPIKTRMNQILKAFRQREQTRKNLRLVIEEGPRAVRTAKGAVKGFAVSVRLFEGKVEVPVDRHRVFINPPLNIFEDGKLVYSPRAALWEILWESVLTNPAPEGWTP